MNDQPTTSNTTSSEERSTYVARETPDGHLLMELWVLYLVTTDAHGDPAARLIRVDDPLIGFDNVQDELFDYQREEIQKDLGLPLVEESGRPKEVTPEGDSADDQEEEEPLEWEEHPRWWRDKDGQYHRVAYRRVEICYWVGGRGPTPRTRYQVWNTDFDTWQEAGKAADPGETFGQIFTTEEFERLTYPTEDLPPVGREAARKALTARPGEEQVCRFVKRTSGELRVMCFRYDPERDRRGRYGYDPKAKGLLPVFDLDKEAPRMVNLDGVRTVGQRRL